MTEIKVHLLRHAHASRAVPGERDHLRGLDDRGRREVESIRDRLLHRPVDVARIVCSTAERARLTLAPLLPVLGAPPPRYDDHLYAMGVEAYEAACLAGDAASPVLLVGHNPTIETFVARWCPGNDERLSSGIKPATWITMQLGIDAAGRLLEGRLLSLTPSN